MYFAILFQVAMGKPSQSFSHLKEVIIPGSSLYVGPSIKCKPEVELYSSTHIDSHPNRVESSLWQVDK